MNPAESLPRLHLVAHDLLSTPGESLGGDTAGNQSRPGSGSLAGTGVVIPFPDRYGHWGYSVKVPSEDGAA